MSAVNRSEQNQTVLVLGRFADPSKAPNYSSGVGQYMSDALARALMHDGAFDVWINPRLTRKVETALALPAAEHEQALGQISREHENVRYVLTGKVTDFYHSTDLPTEVTRWGVFGRRNEAVVAIDLRIVDLKSRRVVGAHHLNGTARAGSGPSGDLYGGVALDSYVFWSTPLGRASKAAIERAVERTVRFVPGGVGDAVVEERLTRRRLGITGGSRAGLVSGREYYLLRPETTTGDRVIRDSDNGRPLMVRIESAGRNSARGFMLGVPPLEQQVRGAVLRSTLPETAQQEQQASATEDDGTDW